LIAVFPKAAVLSIPGTSAPAGRKWLRTRGIIDREVSSAHLQFSRTEGALRVADAGSRNGTWVNGERLDADKNVRLCDGDVLRVGRLLFVYRSELAGDHSPAPPLGDMVGPFGLRRLAADLDSIAQARPSNVLIVGETGTGKELLAALVAQRLGRPKPFAAVNVAGVASGVFESQLFGHTAGAFSDAREASQGIIRRHAGGAVFLDEIGELPLEMQPKLLRLLDNRQVLPVGADGPVEVDVLLIAATNRLLGRMVEEGRFRRDLHARLRIGRLSLPPLRERREDIVAIANTIAGPDYGLVESPQTEVEALEKLMLNRWPDNVRGLMAALAHARRLDAEPGLRLRALESALADEEDSDEPIELTAERVAAALREAKGNESAAARILGVSRGKLRRYRSG